jgi:hemoglobin
MKDITTRAAIKILVDTFYGKVRKDEMLGPVFSHVDWPHHLPIMYNFWSSIVLGDQSYSGSPLAPHLKLPITSTHFERWLALFTETVDECFAGGNADEIKVRAQTIAKMFQHKMGLLHL